MAWHYYDANGEKIGPVRGSELKQLALKGTITPETVVEDENGRRARASDVKGLTFSETAQPVTTLPESASEMAPHEPEPFAVVSQTNDAASGTYGSTGFHFESPTSAAGAVNTFPPVSVVLDVKGQGVPLLSRAVFIFLAVFVGIFGIHDFYAKRVRQGWIHLALLLPWILVILVSILCVFGFTLYALSYSPLRKEMRECERAIKECEKDIKETEQKHSEVEQELAAAMKGRKRIVPQQDKQREIVPRQDEQREVVPPPQREIVPPPPVEIVPPPVEIDREYVRELERSLQELEEHLMKLGQRQRELQSTLTGLRMQRGAQQFEAWVGPVPLWLYFFFWVLPFASWVMAMVEIVYVTKDGIGRELGY